ncbi:acyl-CoA thioesterase [Lysinibacillus yapensis]|uniref:Acyl-CoA thioesterase n=1 Tax=Ureibacillus yapensis TaxID=2304605 RepID=A0A396SEZ6_9BACL|nr:thioesterase family protein [Lysinibacillus yapensis]RHW38596.1 acyl-CoA thioesterase [Lysinibacillus yapensis]
MNYTVKVQWGDTDAAGIVFFPNYYKWMDEATHALFSEIGYPTDQLMKDHLAIPLLETHCVFKQAVSFNVELSIQTSIEFVKEKVFKVNYQFYLEDRLIAEGYGVRAWTSTEGKLKAVPIPEDLRDLLLQHKEEEV